MRSTGFWGVNYVAETGGAVALAGPLLFRGDEIEAMMWIVTNLGGNCGYDVFTRALATP